jgi:hypothetical protein
VPDRAVGAGEVGVAEHGAHRGRLAVAQEQLGGLGELPEALGVLSRLLPEVLVHHEAAGGDPLRGPQQPVQAHRAELLGRDLPRGQRAGHAHGLPGADHGGEVERLAVLGQELVLRERGRGGLAPVDRADLSGLRAVVDEETPAADARGVRLGDAQGGGGGHGGVRGVAAPLEHVDADLARERVHGGDRAAAAGHGGDLGQLGGDGRAPAPVRPVVVRDGRGAAENGAGDAERSGQTQCEVPQGCAHGLSLAPGTCPHQG